MNIHSFGKATATIIVLTALVFLGLFAAFPVANPTLMTPWSSLAYLAIGCSLWINSSSKNGSLVRAGGLVAFAIGAVAYGEYLTGAGSSTFDRMIFLSHLPLDALLPGRPAPIAGIRFCLLGVVLFLAGSRNKPVVLVREWSAIAVIVMCYFGFVSVVIEWGTASPRSISPVAGILGILAAANLLATGQNGHFVPLLQDRGPAGMIARSLMPAAMILPVLNAILGLVFAHFRIYDGTGKVALLSINILTALTILWIGASKVQDIDLLRRKAEDALRASVTRMRLAQQASQVGTFEWNIETGVNVWTPELEAMYGLPQGGFAGMQQTWEELLHPDDRPEVMRRVGEAMASGDFEGEWRVIWPDGTVRWLVGRASVLRDATGKPFCLIGINMDVTDRKRAQDELRESDDRFRNMADHTPVMIWVSGPDKLCTFFNKRWLDFVGRTMEQELGDGWTQGVHPDDLNRCLETYSSAFDERHSFQMEYRLRRADGEYRWVLDSGVPRVSEGGAFTGYVGSCIDTTDTKRTQEQGFHAQKLESLGVLASGIAHDFNNLLGGILAEAELLEANLTIGSESHEIQEDIQRIKTTAIRGSEIVRELMIYAGESPRDLNEAVEVSRLVEEMLNLLKVSISKQVDLRTDFRGDLPTVCGNASQIRQVVMNLVLNASEAIGDTKGVITVTVAQVREGRDLAPNNATDLTPSDYVRIEVSDTGCGMTEETKAKIFDPFFSTKFPGRGLGLSVVQGIVRNLGGAINIVGAPGHGTVFQVLLPRAPKRASEIHSTIAVGEPESHTQVRTILVVEDDETLRRAVSKGLLKRGFSVIEASDGSVALDLIHVRKDEIDLVLLDVTLPGASSREVLEEALRIRPDLKVIVTSAYGEEMVDAYYSGLRVNHFIRKPFHLDDLVRLFGTALSVRAADGRR